MELLSKNGHGKFLNIFWLRFFTVLTSFLLCICLIAFFSIKESNKIAISLMILIILVVQIKLFLTNIVYLTLDGILLISVFTKRLFNYKDFTKIGSYINFTEYLYIQFDDNRKFHIQVIDFRKNDIASGTTDISQTVRQLEDQIDKYKLKYYND